MVCLRELEKGNEGVKAKRKGGEVGRAPCTLPQQILRAPPKCLIHAFRSARKWMRRRARARGARRPPLDPAGCSTCTRPLPRPLPPGSSLGSPPPYHSAASHRVPQGKAPRTSPRPRLLSRPRLSQIPLWVPAQVRAAGRAKAVKGGRWQRRQRRARRRPARRRSLRSPLQETGAVPTQETQREAIEKRQSRVENGGRGRGRARQGAHEARRGRSRRRMIEEGEGEGWEAAGSGRGAGVEGTAHAASPSGREGVAAPPAPSLARP